MYLEVQPSRIVQGDAVLTSTMDHSFQIAWQYFLSLLLSEESISIFVRTLLQSKPDSHSHRTKQVASK